MNNNQHETPSSTKPKAEQPRKNYHRIDSALRNCHGWAVKQHLKRQFRSLMADQHTTKKTTTTCSQNKQIIPKSIIVKAGRETEPKPREVLTDLLLWTKQELNQLRDDLLMDIIETDIIWLRTVWMALFVTPLQSMETTEHSNRGVHKHKNDERQEKEMENEEDNDDDDEEEKKEKPIISWSSWLWAHSIIRSRAVSMPYAPQSVLSYSTTTHKSNHNDHDVIKINNDKKDDTDSASDNDDDQGGKQNGNFSVYSEGVLLPIIDLINHSSSTQPNASLEVRQEGIAVKSTKRITRGEEIAFDYHPHATARHMLRCYGFVVDHEASQPLRQTFRVGKTRIELDVCMLHGLRQHEKGNDYDISRDDDDDDDDEQQIGHKQQRHDLRLMRVTGIYSIPTTGGLRILIRDDDAPAGGEEEGQGGDDGVWHTAGNTTHTTPDKFSDEGQLCYAVAGCCRLVLDNIIQSGSQCCEGPDARACDGDEKKSDGAHYRIASAYRKLNVAVLRRCMDDLMSLGSLLEIG